MPLEWAGIIVMAVLVGASNAGGIGGAALMMPILLIFLKTDVYDAAPLSNFCNFLSALIRFIMTFRRQHPERPRTLQNYEISTVFMPLLMAGTSIGVMVNALLPASVSVALLVVLMGFMFYISLLKFFNLYRRENLKKKNLVGSFKGTDIAPPPKP